MSVKDSFAVLDTHRCSIIQPRVYGHWSMATIIVVPGPPRASTGYRLRWKRDTILKRSESETIDSARLAVVLRRGKFSTESYVGLQRVMNSKPTYDTQSSLLSTLA